MGNLDIDRALSTLIKYALIIDILVFIGLLFGLSFGNYAIIIVNIIILASYKLMEKYSDAFTLAVGVNNLAKKLDSFAGGE